MSLFAELKRRNVLRVAAAYVAVSWLLIQVVETLFPVFGLSDGAIRIIVIVLAIGFIPAVIIAWVFELTPDGLLRDADVDRTSDSVAASTRRLDRIIIVSLALAVGYFALDKFVLDPERDLEREQAIAEAAREEGRAEASRRKENPVIAVLPFDALTENEESNFFAIGVHGDLLAKLAELPSMLVISRTSVMEYRGFKGNLREVGEALGADALLEGGVQIIGERMRINAQLIDAETDENLWADTYDRELTATSIFDIQDDIARSIADALHLTLVEPIERTIPTTNMIAYRKYHEAVEIRENVRGGSYTEEYRTLLREANELDPNFTRPLAELVGAVAIANFSGQNPKIVPMVDEMIARIEIYAPGSVDLLMAQSYYTYYIVKDFDLALDFVNQAIRRMPSDTDLLMLRSYIERRRADFDALIETRQQIRRMDPRNEGHTGNIVFHLLNSHRYDEAAEDIRRHDNGRHYLAFVSAQLAMREHRDFERYLGDIAAVEEKFGDEVPTWRLVWNSIERRDYEAAALLLNKVEEQNDFSPASHMVLSDKLMAEMGLAILQGHDDKKADLLERARAAYAHHVDVHPEGEETFHDTMYVSEAMVAALQGDADETARLIRKWEITGALDWAERVGMRGIVCKILGMGGAAEKAVECIRTGLEEPSDIMPFLETHLPQYDPIRETPEFQALITEISGSQ